MKSCPGKNYVGDDRKWYTLPNSTVYEYTICEACYDKNIKDLPNADQYGEYEILTYCNCDYPTNPNYIMKSKSIIDINIVDDKVKNYEFVDGVFLLPANSNYSINICYYGKQWDYFTLESGFIGKKPIIINQRDQIFCKDLLIQGYETGTKSSFLFVPLKEHELNDVSDTITLTFKQWHRIPRRRTGFVDCCYEGKTINGNKQVDHVKTQTTNDHFIAFGDTLEYKIMLGIKSNLF